MLAWLIAASVSLLLSVFVPLWLIWPLGVLMSVYILSMRRRRQALQLSDAEILWAFVGVLSVLLCRLYLFWGL